MATAACQRATAAELHRLAAGQDGGPNQCQRLGIRKQD